MGARGCFQLVVGFLVVSCTLAQLEIFFPSSRRDDIGKDCWLTPTEKGICTGRRQCSHMKDIPSNAFNGGRCGVSRKQDVVCCPNSRVLVPAKEGDRCRITDVSSGTCQNFLNCEENHIPGVADNSRFCNLDTSIPIVCCPTGSVKAQLREIEKPIETECFNEDLRCGTPYSLPYYFGHIGDETKSIYYMNETADKLTELGYVVQPLSVRDDALLNFTYSNATFSGYRGFDGMSGVAAVGGRPAAKERSYFMALLGEKIGSSLNWYCDGVLINRLWILSAAHCFAQGQVQINVIRLGELNWEEPPKTYYDNQPVDYTIEKTIIHPKFSVTSRYYDLVLLKIPTPILRYQHSSRPICLPWGNHTLLSHIGKNLTLSGWGATGFGKEKTPRLQEVDLEVMDSAICDKSYSTLSDYKRKYSQGITADKILCAGSPEGGKDACKGDSGAPLVYHVKHNRMYLGGIVSTGFGCGLKEFPGLYIPINNPEILQWIKDTAFSEC